MKRLWLLLPIVPITGCIAVVGCTPHDRDDAIDQGAAITKRAVDATVSAAGEAWKVASAEAAKLTPESGEAALRRAQKGLEEAKDKLQPGKRLDEAKAQLARLRAALDVDVLRHELDEKAAEVQKLKEHAGKTVEDVREKLISADRDYRDLKEKLASAETAYDSAKQKADDLASSLRGG